MCPHLDTRKCPNTSTSHTGFYYFFNYSSQTKIDFKTQQAKTVTVRCELIVIVTIA
eukprot:m.273183 g.273183  ORF g.273183 m.273183 type:complete len:56 (-) comp105394_c0_seq1:50-217(-)